MFERRLQILLGVMVAVCVAIGVRAVALQAVGRSHWTEQAVKALSDETQIPTVRGRILDVKGRELAIDQPCIDACVHYEAVAATRTLGESRAAALVRLKKAGRDEPGLTDAERRRRVDVDVAAQLGEGGPATAKWMRDTARARLKRRVDNYPDLPLDERKRLLAAETSAVVADIDTMWHDLATLSDRTDEQIDQIRRQIVRRVETRRRLVWYAKYSAAATRPAESTWYGRLLGAAKAGLDQFDVHVQEEADEHIVLPHIDYALRNELARRIDRYPGLDLREGVRRIYPQGSVACQTIGRIAKVTPEDLEADPRRDEPLGKYAATDDIGRDGLEKMLEPQLRGTRGVRTADAAAGPNDAAADETPPVPGQDVVTTLDVALQAKVERAFKSVTFTPNNDIGNTQMEMPGAAVVIDVPTGEVRAMASWPTYDLNTFDADFPRLVKDQVNRPLTNRATLMAVEPGSTVKPIVGMGAITDGVIGPLETIHCGGFLVLGNRKYDFGRCWTMQMHKKTHHETWPDPHPTNDLTFPEALQRSCNVFHETLADRMGVGRVSFWFDKFGLGRPTGIGLPEAKGLKPDGWVGPASQRLSNTCLSGIGEGHVAATPVQMANVAATIARDGRWVPPTLQPLGGPPAGVVDLRVAPVALAEAREGMVEVVNTPAGTGHSARMEGVVVAAKTGSAQTGPLRLPLRDTITNKALKDPQGRVKYQTVTLGTHANPNPEAPWYRAIGDREEKLPAYAWMIGYAPADRPRVAFAVLVEFGGGGGTAAGSVVQKLLVACEEEGYLTAAAE